MEHQIEGPHPRKDCKIPLELCEAIMDAIPRSDTFLTPDEHETLLACADVCPAWRIRANAIINRDMDLMSRRAVALFVSAVRNASPDRVGFIKSLFLSRDCSIEGLGQMILSRVMDLLMTPLPRLYDLSLHNCTVDLGPRILRMGLPLFASLTSLACTGCDFDTYRTMLDVVWSCRGLKKLLLERCRFRDDHLTAENAARLSAAQRNSRGCRNLEMLTVDTNLTATALPGDVFGSSLTSLKLSVGHGELTTQRDVSSFFQGVFPKLQELSIIMHYEKVSKVACEAPSLLHALISPPSSGTIITMSISIYGESWGCERTTEDAIEWCRRLVGRVDDWVDRPLRSLLTSVRKLSVCLFMLTKRKDGEASAEHILSVIPDAHDALQVSIRSLTSLNVEIVYQGANCVSPGIQADDSDEDSYAGSADISWE